MKNRYLKSILVAGAMMLPVAMIGQTAQTNPSAPAQPNVSFAPSLATPHTVSKKYARVDNGMKRQKGMPMKVAQPEGEAVPYMLNEYVSDGAWVSHYNGGVAIDIYFDGDDVYYRDIVSLTGDGEYIKGTITQGDSQNGVLTFENGAKCASDQKVYVATTDSEGYLVPDTDAKDFSFKIQNGVITPITEGLATPNMYLLAVGYDDYIYSFCSILSIVPVTWDTTSISVPEGLTETEVIVDDHAYDTNELTERYMAHQAIDGENIYLTDLFQGLTDATLLLKKAGDTAKISNGSYIGIFDDCYTFIYAGKIMTQTDDYGDEVFVVAVDYDCENLVFKIDEDGKITTDNLLILLQGELVMVGSLNKPVIEPYNPGIPAVMPPASEINAMLLMTDDLSSPSNVVYKYSTIKVGVDGDDVYFSGFMPEYPDFTFKGVLNDDKTKITVTLPQYLGRNEYDCHIFLYDGDFEEVPYSEDYSYVNYYYTDETSVLEMGVKDGEIYLDGALVPAELFWSASEGFINPVISRLPDLEEVRVPDDAEEMSYALTWKTKLSSDTRKSKRVTVAKAGKDYYFYDFAAGDNHSAFKGTETEDGEGIAVNFPQYCGLNSEGKPVYAMLSIGRDVDFSYDIYSFFNNTLESKTVTFSLKNGSIATDEIINVAALDNVLSAVIAPEWIIIDAGVPDMPTNSDTYILNYENAETVALRPAPINVAIDGNQCFMDFNINGLSCIVEGTMQADKIEVKAPAYVNEEGLLWLSGGEFTYDEWGDVIIGIDDSQTTLTFEYDSQNQRITCPEVLIFHGLGGSVVSVIVNGKLTKYIENGMPPKMPVINDWYFVSLFDQYLLDCEIPWTATDGSLLDTDNMFFRIWFDDVVMIWNPEVYDNFTEPVENVPYNTHADLISPYYNSDTYDLWFNDSPEQYLGLQSAVVQGGEYYWSEIVWYDVISHTVVNDPYVSVETVQPSECDVRSHQYYTMDGRMTDKPSKGLCIEKTTHKNGQTSVRKIVFK